MGTGAITSYVDVAQLVLYLFWVFFAGVIYYLVRENRREGYPLETHHGVTTEGWIAVPKPKTYLLEGGATVQAPQSNTAPQTGKGERMYGFEGTPIEPLGNPLTAGVGAGAWVQRADHPDRDHHGEPKIRPLAVLPQHNVSHKDPDPRGMTVIDARDQPVGTVADLWLDVPEMLFRYMDVQLADGSRRLVPMTFCRMLRSSVKVHALLSSQWHDVPTTKSRDTITLLEEERIAAAFGAGMLYATPQRSEPLI